MLLTGYFSYPYKSCLKLMWIASVAANFVVGHIGCSIVLFPLFGTVDHFASPIHAVGEVDCCGTGHKGSKDLSISV
jgi:hypothetical protein